MTRNGKHTILVLSQNGFRKTPFYDDKDCIIISGVFYVKEVEISVKDYVEKINQIVKKGSG